MVTRASRSIGHGPGGTGRPPGTTASARPKPAAHEAVAAPDAAADGNPGATKADAPAVAACACYRARSMARAITGLYDEMLDASGLRATQLAILSAIRSRGAASMQVLATELGVDPSTMTRTLAPMERDGFVASEAGEDRRVRELVLTAKGHRKLAEAGKLWSGAQQRLREKIGADRFDRLLDDMDAVLAALRDDAAPGSLQTQPSRRASRDAARPR